MTKRDAELSSIARFLAERGVTKCPPRPAKGVKQPR